MRTKKKAPPHVVFGRFFFVDDLDGESDEAEDGADPQQRGEAAKQLSTTQQSGFSEWAYWFNWLRQKSLHFYLFAELHPLGGRGGWREGIWAVPGQDLFGPGVGKTLKKKEKKGGRMRDTARVR